MRELLYSAHIRYNEIILDFLSKRFRIFYSCIKNRGSFNLYEVFISDKVVLSFALHMFPEHVAPIEVTFLKVQCICYILC